MFVIFVPEQNYQIFFAASNIYIYTMFFFIHIYIYMESYYTLYILSAPPRMLNSKQIFVLLYT